MRPHEREKLRPDRGQLKKFALALFKYADPAGIVSLRAFYEDKHQQFAIKPMSAGDLDEVVDAAVHIAGNAANDVRPVVFAPPIATFNNRQHAREQDLLQGLALSTECDHEPSKARAKLQALLGPATVVVRSGGVFMNGDGAAEDKLHLHFRLANPAAGADLAKLKEARMLAARIISADPSGKPSVHPFRWPGSWHRKQEPRLCSIVELNPDGEIDLDAALGKLRAAAPAKSSDTKKKSSGETDQSPSGKFYKQCAIFFEQDWTVKETVKEFVEHPERYADTSAERYQAEGRLHQQVKVCFDKWLGESILVCGGELPRIVDQAERVLLASGHEIYQRGEFLVRPAVMPLRAADDRDTEGWRLIEVDEPYLVDVMTRTAPFRRWDARSQRWVRIDAPNKVAKTLLARVGEWKAPVLLGVVGTPFLRSDGSLCQTPGYDAASGLLFKTDGVTFPPIPEHPSKDDARKALAKLKYPIKDFPFVTEADRSVALSGFLTALDRRSMLAAPLHSFDAPAAGMGKSKLVDIAAAIATGNDAPVISQGKDEEELEKRISSALLAGDAIISIDNCTHALDSALLCQALTQTRVQVRVLGKSVQPEVPGNATMFATRNGLVFVGDLTRRVLRASIDAGIERPELREFAFEPVALVKQQRPQLAMAALTILLAYRLSGERVKVKPFGSFEDWSRRVREALVWLDCADPCSTVEKLRGDDPARAALDAVMMGWEAILGFDKPYTAREVIEAVGSGRPEGFGMSAGGKMRCNFTGNDRRMEFKEALFAVAGRGNKIDAKQLGIWLGQNKDRIVSGACLVPKGSKGGARTWVLRVAV